MKPIAKIGLLAIATQFLGLLSWHDKSRNYFDAKGRPLIAKKAQFF